MTVLVCSDGLYDAVSEAELAGMLIEAGDLEVTADRLIARANDHGAPDNVTAVLVRWVG